MTGEGSLANPVRLNNHFFGPILKEVHWGGYIAILSWDAPDNTRYDFNAPWFEYFIPPGSFYNDGDTIPKTDWADNHDTPVIRPFIDFGGDPILSNYYDITRTFWEIEAVSQLSDTAFDNSFAGFNTLQTLYSSSGPNFRFQTTSDMRGLTDPPAASGVIKGSFGFPNIPDTHPIKNGWSGHWGTSYYGFYTHLSHTSGGTTFPDDDIPGYFAIKQPDPTAAAETSTWGLGEHKVPFHGVRNRIRAVRLIDFSLLPPDEDITIFQHDVEHDDDMGSANSVFTLKIYSGGTFKASASDFTVINEGGTLISTTTKTLSYDVNGDTLVTISHGTGIS